MILWYTHILFILLCWGFNNWRYLLLLAIFLSSSLPPGIQLILQLASNLQLKNSKTFKPFSQVYIVSFINWPYCRSSASWTSHFPLHTAQSTLTLFQIFLLLKEFVFHHSDPLMIIPWLNQTLITISSAANLTYFILILVFCIPKYLILIIILVLIQFKWETDTNINIFFWSLFLKCVWRTFSI